MVDEAVKSLGLQALPAKTNKYLLSLFVCLSWNASSPSMVRENPFLTWPNLSIFIRELWTGVHFYRVSFFLLIYRKTLLKKKEKKKSLKIKEHQRTKARTETSTYFAHLPNMATQTLEIIQCYLISFLSLWNVQFDTL